MEMDLLKLVQGLLEVDGDLLQTHKKTLLSTKSGRLDFDLLIIRSLNHRTVRTSSFYFNLLMVILLI